MRLTEPRYGEDREKDMVYPSQFHKQHRLMTYDYSSPGSYMLTICVAGRNRILSKVEYRGMYEPAGVELTPTGRIAEKYINKIPHHYSCVTVDNYVIMPDHIHLLLTIEPDVEFLPKRPDIHTIIRMFKTMTTKELGYSIWQDSFYDVIAETEERFLICQKYIDENPAAWLEKQDEPFLPK